MWPPAQWGHLLHERTSTLWAPPQCGHLNVGSLFCPKTSWHASSLMIVACRCPFPKGEGISHPRVWTIPFPQVGESPSCRVGESPFSRVENALTPSMGDVPFPGLIPEKLIKFVLFKQLIKCLCLWLFSAPVAYYRSGLIITNVRFTLDHANRLSSVFQTLSRTLTSKVCIHCC